MSDVRNKASCIIPAHNEEKTVAGVIKTCLKTPEIGEVIIVNDGSRDKTVEKVKKFKEKVALINLPKNTGKGSAVIEGVKISQYNYLLFLDADLINLKPHHLSSLIRPVINKEVDMVIGPNNIFLKRPKLIPAILAFCGQRCLRKKIILPFLKELSESKYGLEIVLNDIFKKKKIAVVPLISNKNLHLIKPKKQKDWFSSYVKEIWQVTQKTIKTRSEAYQAKIKEQILENLSLYFKTNIRKIKEYLQEDV